MRRFATRLGWLAIGWALAAPAIAAEPCRVTGLPHEVLCGSVTRALNPAQPDSTRIEVHYVVVPALARRKLPDPVFLLAGGPGQSAISLASSVMPLFARLNNRRDIVFVDQRGTGRSAPLVCDDPQRLPVAEQADPQRQLALLRQCREALARLPYGDLRFFTTELAMQDLEAVRRQIGAPRINLVAASYGTRAALSYQQQFPQAVRRAVLDGVVPPDMVLPASASPDAQTAFDAMLADCAHDAGCARRYPALGTAWRTWLARLPQRVRVQHPLTGEDEQFLLTRDMALTAVRGALYAPVLTQALPAAIHAATQGRVQALLTLHHGLTARRGGELAMGMHFSVVCAEDMPRLAASPDAPGADFGRSGIDLYQSACHDWPRGEVSQAFYRLTPASAPTLLLSGGIDPAAPPRHAERVARALGAQARHVVVPNAGHGVMGQGCMPDILTHFVAAQTGAQALDIDAGCATAIPRPFAFVPLSRGVSP